jgi:hypothetical protein
LSNHFALLLCHVVCRCDFFYTNITHFAGDNKKKKKRSLMINVTTVFALCILDRNWCERCLAQHITSRLTCMHTFCQLW